MTDQLLRKAEVAEHLGLSRATLERLITRGELPVVRVSERTVRISEASLRDFIQRRTERSGR